MTTTATPTIEIDVTIMSPLVNAECSSDNKWWLEIQMTGNNSPRVLRKVRINFRQPCSSFDEALEEFKDWAKHRGLGSFEPAIEYFEALDRAIINEARDKIYGKIVTLPLPSWA